MSRELNIDAADLRHTWDIVAIERRASMITYPNRDVGLTADDVRKWPWKERQERYSEMLFDPDASVSVALLGKQVVGFAASRRDGELAHLRKLYVDPVHQSQGIGKALLGEAETWAMENGATVMELDVTDYNTAARHFYEREGYMLAHNPGPQLVASIGVHMTLLSYEKTLLAAEGELLYERAG